MIIFMIMLDAMERDGGMASKKGAVPALNSGS